MGYANLRRRPTVGHACRPRVPASRGFMRLGSACLVRTAATPYHCGVTLSEAYSILGVERDASFAAVKAAYRVRALATHPDRGGDPRQFIRVQAAYEIVCGFLHEQVTETDIPVPEELRGLIDSILRDFRIQLGHAEESTDRFFASFEASMFTYVRTASRAELRDFSTHFRREWQSGLGSLFGGFNQEYRSIVGRYDGWFSQFSETAFEDAFRAQWLRAIRGGRFWQLVAGLFVVGFVAGMWLGDAWRGGVGGPSWRIVCAMLVPAGYWLRARKHRATPRDLAPLQIQLFTLDERADFQASHALKEARKGTVSAGFAGAVLGDMIAVGLAGPVLGAVAGLALGGVAGRLLNPTESIRRSLESELQAFFPAARRSVTGYVLESHRRVIADLQGEIVRNYEQRVRETARLLAAG
jgi:hypothetical protein